VTKVKAYPAGIVNKYYWRTENICCNGVGDVLMLLYTIKQAREIQMTIKIDQNIPFPSVASRYPFGEMERGESFFVPNGRTSTITTAKHAAKLEGRKFSARAVEEKGIKGVRVWRIS
jgi:hypothetical protein